MIGPAWLLLSAVLGAAEPQSEANLEKLTWMAGCWQGQLGTLTVEEWWTKPAGGVMLGMSRNMKNGKAIFSEFMRIERRGEDFYYIARIGDSKQSPTPFKLVRSSAEEAVFENPEHDFPQRIIYRPTAQGLQARIEGESKGKLRGEDYPMQRGSCQ